MAAGMLWSWLLVASAFVVPFGLGIWVQALLESRDPSREGLVGLFYLAIPMASAVIVAIVLRSHLSG